MLCDSFIELTTLAARACVLPYMPKYAIINIHMCISFIFYAYTYECVHIFVHMHTPIYMCIYKHIVVYPHMN